MTSPVIFSLLVLLVLVLENSSSGAEVIEKEDFSCHGKNSWLRRKNGPEGVILPRGDITISVNESKETSPICRFNSSLINATDVFFYATNYDLKTKIVNSSTVETTLPNAKPDGYILYCRLRRKAGMRTKDLCKQTVLAGAPPVDVEDLFCISRNNREVNCTWKYPKNPVRTDFLVSYEVPRYQVESDCPSGQLKSYCFWNPSKRVYLKEFFNLIFKAKNELGSRVFIHPINVEEIVKPDKVSAFVELLKPTVAHVRWNLTYPLDVFYGGLWHSVEYRLANPEYKFAAIGNWQNVTLFFHKKAAFDPLYPLSNPVRMFDLEVDLPYANQEYNFRVRIHTGVGDIRENMWSEYELLKLKAGPALPEVAPITSMSTFETVELLDNRKVYVNFRRVDSLYYNGGEFHYEVDAFKRGSTKRLDLEPYSVTNSYVQFDSLDFTEYRFKIYPVNVMGRGEVFSEVIVPNSDCMPKKTNFLTVITRERESGKMYSLYWLQSKPSNDECTETTYKKIDSYTLFWCKRTGGERCKNKLEWMELSGEDLVLMDWDDVSTVKTKLYVRNLTDLDDGAGYTFGIAANSGNFSSGIRWSSCIVDEKEAPHAPTDVEVYAKGSREVIVKWSLKCSARSAVPLGFNVSYCQSNVTDFGHCSSEVEHVNVEWNGIMEVVISDLLPGASYIFSVALLSIIGEGRQSVPKRTILGDEIPSGPPIKALLSRVTNTSVTLKWSPPKLRQRNGAIVEYRIRPFERTISVKDGLQEEFTYTVEGLRPFTSYDAKIVACTKVGCGEGSPARVKIRTEPGVPPPVDHLMLDVSNWKLTWDLAECRSLSCFFQVRIPVNESLVINATVKDVESVSLRELEVPCNMSEMSFLVRAIGEDESGSALIGNWTKVTKEENYCPKGTCYWENLGHNYGESSDRERGRRYISFLVNTKGVSRVGNDNRGCVWVERVGLSNYFNRIKFVNRNFQQKVNTLVVVPILYQIIERNNVKLNSLTARKINGSNRTEDAQNIERLVVGGRNKSNDDVKLLTDEAFYSKNSKENEGIGPSSNDSLRSLKEFSIDIENNGSEAGIDDGFASTIDLEREVRDALPKLNFDAYFNKHLPEREMDESVIHHLGKFEFNGGVRSSSRENPKRKIEDKTGNLENEMQNKNKRRKEFETIVSSAPFEKMAGLVDGFGGSEYKAGRESFDKLMMKLFAPLKRIFEQKETTAGQSKRRKLDDVRRHRKNGGMKKSNPLRLILSKGSNSLNLTLDRGVDFNVSRKGGRISVDLEEKFLR